MCSKRRETKKLKKKNQRFFFFVYDSLPGYKRVLCEKKINNRFRKVICYRRTYACVLQGVSELTGRFRRKSERVNCRLVPRHPIYTCVRTFLTKSDGYLGRISTWVVYASNMNENRSINPLPSRASRRSCIVVQQRQRRVHTHTRARCARAHIVMNTSRIINRYICTNAQLDWNI